MPGYYRPPYSSRPPGKHPRRSQPQPGPRRPAPIPGFAPVPSGPGLDDSIELSSGQAELVADAVSRLAVRHKTAIIEYVDRNNRKTTREVEPYAIRGLFLKTRCRLAGGPRSFELSRVLSVLEGQTFEPLFPIEFEAAETGPEQDEGTDR